MPEKCLYDQLLNLYTFAFQNGFYDAADIIKEHIEHIEICELNGESYECPHKFRK